MCAKLVGRLKLYRKLRELIEMRLLGDAGPIVCQGSMVIDAPEPRANAAVSTAPSTVATVEETFSEGLLAQMRQLKAQKAEVEASLVQLREDARVREQELLYEVASARNATGHAQQQAVASDQRREALEDVRTAPEHSQFLKCGTLCVCAEG
jgi:hypothetical protein